MMNNNIVSPTDLQLNDETVIQIKRVSRLPLVVVEWDLIVLL